jgi:hypothetical protein
MNEEKLEWMLKGQGTEACTSPPVCPIHFGSPAPKDLHNGESQCESMYSFYIQEGYSNETDLSELNVCISFNIPPGYPETKSEKWPSILYIDERANDTQAGYLEKIYRFASSQKYRILKTKKARIYFKKELINNGPAAKHIVKINGIYDMRALPLLTNDGEPRQINTITGGIINIGKSEINRYEDTDLPRTWNMPGMSNIYFDFELSPIHTYWLP